MAHYSPPHHHRHLSLFIRPTTVVGGPEFGGRKQGGAFNPSSEVGLGLFLFKIKVGSNLGLSNLGDDGPCWQDEIRE